MVPWSWVRAFVLARGHWPSAVDMSPWTRNLKANQLPPVDEESDAAALLPRRLMTGTVVDWARFPKAPEKERPYEALNA